MAEILSATLGTLVSPITFSVSHTHANTPSRQSTLFSFLHCLLLKFSLLSHCLYLFLSPTLFLSLYFCFFFISRSSSLHPSFLHKAFPPSVCGNTASLSLSPFFDESLLLATVDISENVVERFVSDFRAEFALDFTISKFVRSEYRAEFLSVDQPAQTARPTDPADVEALRAMVREGGWVSEFSTCTVAEKNFPSMRRVQKASFVDDKLAVSLCLTDGFRRRAMSQTVDDS